jgi:hypothetical protein
LGRFFLVMLQKIWPLGWVQLFGSILFKLTLLICFLRSVSLFLNTSSFFPLLVRCQVQRLLFNFILLVQSFCLILSHHLLVLNFKHF